MGLLFVVLFSLIVLILLSLLAIAWGLLLGWIFPSMTTGEALLTGAVLAGFAMCFVFYLLNSLKGFEMSEEEIITILPNFKSRPGTKPRKK